ncbi:hypothetical protein BVG19_g5116 [[Candida] boidinii]|nr:hypothetical protein BVG19_g5116 [[Candida] boidinii]OWB50386.1 hypothetical protein B5S27_g1936 [[Candida] boidinii]
MTVSNDFIDSQKTIYKLKPLDDNDRDDSIGEADNEADIYREGIPFDSDIPFLRLMNGKEPIENVHKRYNLFQQYWGELSPKIDSLLSSLNVGLLEELKNFLIEHDDISSNEGVNTNIFKIDDKLKINTAFLNLGSNISNHSRLLNKTIEFLQNDEYDLSNGKTDITETDDESTSEEVNPKEKRAKQDIEIIRLNSKNCGSIKSAIKTLVVSLLEKINKEKGFNLKTTLDDYSDDDDEDELEEINDYDNEDSRDNNNSKDDRFMAFRSSSRVDLDMIMDYLKYKNKKLIIIIEDIDSFNLKIFNLLVKIFWYYLNDNANQISLIIGISTSILIIFDKLSKNLINYLNFKKFEIDNSDKIIENLFDLILFDKNSVNDKLIYDPLIINELNDLYNRNLLSVNKFISTIKLLCMNKFFNQPMSYLIDTDDENEIQLSDDYIELLRRFKSVKRFDEFLKYNNNSSLIFSIKESQFFLKSIVENNKDQILNNFRFFFKILKNYNKNLINLIDFIDFLQDFLIDLNFKKWVNKFELYLIIFQNLNSMSKSNAEPDNKDSSSSDLNFLNFIFEKLKELEDELIYKIFIDSIKENKEWVEILGIDIKDNDIKNKDKVINNLQKMIRKLLIKLNLSQLPFNEIFLIDYHYLFNVKLTINPNLRYNLNNAMTNSRYYLINYLHINNEELNERFGEGGGDRVNGIFDDSFKLYKLMEPSVIELYRLYREANTIINIYDFYTAFKYSLPKLKLVKLINGLINNGSDDDDERVKRILYNNDNRINRDEIDSDFTDLKKSIRGILEVMTSKGDKRQDDEDEMLDLDEDEYDDNDDDDDDYEWDKITLSWFLQQLVELNIIGYLKENKSKNEFFEKLVWKGI